MLQSPLQIIDASNFSFLQWYISIFFKVMGRMLIGKKVREWQSWIHNSTICFIPWSWDVNSWASSKRNSNFRRSNNFKLFQIWKLDRCLRAEFRTFWNSQSSQRAKFFRQLGYQLGAIINKQVMKCRGLSLPQYMPLLPLWHLCKFKLLKRVKWLFGGQRTIELFSHFCYSMHPSNGKEFQRRKLS